MTKSKEQVITYIDELGKLHMSQDVDLELFNNLAKRIGASYYREYDFFIKDDDTLIEKIYKEFHLLKIDYTIENLRDIIKKVINSLKGKSVSKIAFYYVLVKETKVETKGLDKDLLNFGENLILSQQDIDTDIKNIVDNNFSSLF